MILAVALNPALDVTYHVDGVDWAGVNRPARVAARAGGKGLNVARVLHALGTPVRVTGLAGGPAGEAVLAGLAEAGLPAAFTAIAGPTRQTVAVVDTSRGETALFNEPGPRVSPAEYEQFSRDYRQQLGDAAAVVLSGSLPPGADPGSYAELIRAAAAAGVPAVLDSSGAALLAGVAAGPAIVKPNLAELEQAAGASLAAAGSPDDLAVSRAAASLAGRGAGAVVVSLGAHGLLAMTGTGCWRAEPGCQVAGNPTGAGDAVVAGLADGLVRGLPWADRLRHACALGTAAAAAPAAGEFCQDDYERALAGVRLAGKGEG
ncbi:MAG TPA: hexose kinase [Streptosporangiaceae bacterium]